MNKTIFIIIIFIILQALNWLICAGIAKDINPCNWSELVRIFSFYLSIKSASAALSIK